MVKVIGDGYRDGDGDGDDDENDDDDNDDDGDEEEDEDDWSGVEYISSIFKWNVIFKCHTMLFVFVRHCKATGLFIDVIIFLRVLTNLAWTEVTEINSSLHLLWSSK